VWKQLFELLRGALFLGRDAVELHREVTHLREEMVEVQRALGQLARDFEHLAGREKLERDKLVLQLENAMLRLARRLPPGKSAKE
jgi:hypothetical protein